MTSPSLSPAHPSTVATVGDGAKHHLTDGAVGGQWGFISIIEGDCIKSMRAMKARGEHVQMCVTSPPYFGLRDYGAEGQIGLEQTPAEYVAKMVSVFSAVRDVLAEDGTLWINLGDSYANDSKWGGASGGKHANALHGDTGIGRGKKRTGIAAKNLMLIPSRVAMALQDDGWILRAACPWLKRNGMPDSTRDRPTQTIEWMFLFAKSAKYFYDGDAVMKPAKDVSIQRISQPNYENQIGSDRANAGAKTNGNMKAVGGSTRLRRSSDSFFESWQGMLQSEDGDPLAFVVNTKPYREAHFATFPPKLIEPCILSGLSEKGCCPSCGQQWRRVCERVPMVIDRSERTHELGRTRSSGTMVSPALSTTVGWEAACGCGVEPVLSTILDPFGGSGTTGEVAKNLGRNAVLLELNHEYADLARKRCGITSPTIGELDFP